MKIITHNKEITGKMPNKNIDLCNLASYISKYKYLAIFVKIKWDFKTNQISFNKV